MIRGHHGGGETTRLLFCRKQLCGSFLALHGRRDWWL